MDAVDILDKKNELESVSAGLVSVHFSTFKIDGVDQYRLDIKHVSMPNEINTYSDASEAVAHLQSRINTF